MLIEVWDRTTLARPGADDRPHEGQAGAPLGAAHEFDKVDLSAKDTTVLLVVPIDAHIRLAARSVNNDTRILRRGYSFTDGMDERLGQLDAGLFFIASSTTRSRSSRSRSASGETTRSTSTSRTGAAPSSPCPPGVAQGGYIADRLFT